MEFLTNIGPFILAVIAVVINGVPQLLYAQTRGFALKPAGFAYFIGAIGNLLTGSVTPISSQAETITVASVKKDLRNNVSSILLAAVLMVIMGLCGGITAISEFAGEAVIAGMMSGVGLMLASVSMDMFQQEKRTTIISVVSAIVAYALFLNNGNKVVWTIFISVVVSTADFLFLQKRRVDLTTMVEDGRDMVANTTEWRFWKKEYWADFKFIKPTINMTVVMGALSLLMLNIGANISGTAGAPWPVYCGIAFMIVTGLLILTGLVTRLGKYLPAQSISGFLLVIGFALTFAPNLQAVSTSENSMSGYIALGVTAWSKNPFLGMVCGVLVRFFGQYVGLV